ncbi:adenosylcobinamide-GDP ribazoletransferase [Halalkalibacter alkalisediminis]|uniref:Adenosylcobinamide-GDP ribazoletransferase n=1 Tax=Halalkalibacter alkalisediminis TaxID=935616 RepID=A0ABV6NGK0_9BACI|nr:adenosylcobinamide-GDP ribazoletransferase [Halalkalibacter alkalisediminis]
MKHKLRIWVDGTMLAFQLLTTVPIRKQIEWDDERAKASVSAYPLVGLILGTLMALQWFIFTEYTSISPFVLVGWLLTFSILFSGGLHLDGWADFHDAVFSRRSREQKLEIMKDPRVGTFGVLALLFVVGWRFIFMLEIVKVATPSTVLAVIVIYTLVRLMLGWQVLQSKFARAEGMAAALQPAKTKVMVIIYLIWTIGLALLLLVVSPSLISLLLAAVFFLVIWKKWVNDQLAGITGDTIGAGAEGGETFLWGILWFLLL